jgi:type IV secretion system protein VirD4
VPERAEHPFERIGGFALAALLALGLFLELSATLGGLVSGSGWTAIPVDALPAGIAHLWHHLDDPRQAFPAGRRGALPAAPVWYGSMLAVVIAASLIARRVRRRDGGASPSARWARQRDISCLRSGPARGRIVLGRLGRHTLASEQHQSLLVVAPTQSGKTTSLAVPAILEWDGPVVAVSVKTDLLRDTVLARARVGAVSVFDPTGATGVEAPASWTPLAACADWAGARRVASWLTEGAAPAKRSLHDGDFWYSAAAKLLAPVLFAAAASKRTMADVVGWIDTQEEHAVIRALEATGSEEALQAM